MKNTVDADRLRDIEWITRSRSSCATHLRARWKPRLSRDTFRVALCVRNTLIACLFKMASHALFRTVVLTAGGRAWNTILDRFLCVVCIDRWGNRCGKGNIHAALIGILSHHQRIRRRAFTGAGCDRSWLDDWVGHGGGGVAEGWEAVRVRIEQQRQLLRGASSRNCRALTWGVEQKIGIQISV